MSVLARISDQNDTRNDPAGLLPITEIIGSNLGTAKRKRKSAGVDLLGSVLDLPKIGFKDVRYCADCGLNADVRQCLLSASNGSRRSPAFISPPSAALS